MQIAANLLIGLAVVALILVRQLHARAVREDTPYRTMLILGVIGVVETGQFVGQHTVSDTAWALLAVSLVIGIGFGLARGATVHVWRRDGVLTRQGNAITIVLWVIGLGCHLGMDALIGHTDHAAEGLGSVAILIYLALTLSAQQVITLRRAEHLEAGPSSAFGQPGAPA